MSALTDSSATRTIVIEKLLESIESNLKPNEVKPEMSLREDLDFDSLASVELVIELEEEFNIALKNEDIERLVTVQDVLDLTDEVIAETKKEDA